MCGISGVYGEYATIKSMLMTLNMLERGVQGCGIAYVYNDKIVTIKEAINPVEFFNKYFYELNIDVKLAISHNRMPSIGKVCYENTHPFVSCDRYFALIHNGTAFNGYLRKLLKSEGHEILGETDSELLTHILEDLYYENGNMVKALENLMKNYLSGSIIVLTADNELYACKTNNYPVHYVNVNNEIYIASSEKAIRKLLSISGYKNIEVKTLEEGYILAVKHGTLRLYKCLTHTYFIKYFDIEY